MKITLESTTEIRELNGVPGRIWQGKTESGVDVYAFIVRVACHRDDDASQFERELIETHVKATQKALAAFPLRLVI